MVACPLRQAAINTAARGRVGVKSERDEMGKGCGNVKRKGSCFVQRVGLALTPTSSSTRAEYIHLQLHRILRN